MLDSLVHLLDRFGSVVLWSCIAIVITIDVAAVAAVLVTRSRDVVNKWAKPVIAANVFLLGAGVGVPAAALVAKAAVRVIAPSVHEVAAKTQPIAVELREK